MNENYLIKYAKSTSIYEKKVLYFNKTLNLLKNNYVKFIKITYWEEMDEKEKICGIAYDHGNAGINDVRMFIWFICKKGHTDILPKL